MRKRNVFAFVTALFLLAPMMAYAAINPSNIPNLPSIAALQALGGASAQYNTVNVQSYYAGNNNLGGGVFQWNAASTTTVDSCNVFAATGVTTGRWFRQTESGSLGIPLVNCGAHGDGTTNDAGAFALAKTAIEASGKFGLILGNQGLVFKVNTGLTFDIDKECLDLRNSMIDATSFSSSGTFLHLDASNANPVAPRSCLANGGILGPSGGNPGTTGTGVLESGTLGGIVSHISWDDFYVESFHIAEAYGSNAPLIEHHHIMLIFNDIGISMPSGLSNTGENEVYDGESTITASTSYAADIEFPAADFSFTDDSIDYNQTHGLATDCQIKIVDAHVTITGGHSEDFTHPLDCITSSTSAPQLSLQGHHLIRVSGASSKLVDSGSGGLVSITGGDVSAASSPQTLIGPSSGGVMFVQGLELGTAAFSTSVGTYTLCSTIGACTSNQMQVADVFKTRSFNQCSATFSIPSNNTPVVFGSGAASTITLTDGTHSSSYLWSSGAITIISNNIPNFTLSTVGGFPAGAVSSGAPVSPVYCQTVMQ